MKKIIALFGNAVLVSALAFFGTNVQAVGLYTDVNVNAGAEVGVGGNATSAKTKASVSGNATSSAAKENQGLGTNATTTVGADGQAVADEHESAVAAFVSALLDVADHDQAIGAEVRAVAQAQNDSASTTAVAIAAVESKGSVSTFLFGSDYKNLGVIRSELATTSNNIARLEAARDRATDASVKAELTAEITALENEYAKVSAYVEAHEDTFSLLGWFVKLFVE